MKRMLCLSRLLFPAVLFALTMMLSACGGNAGAGTTLDFAFHPGEAADYSHSKALYITQDEKRVLLDASLTLASGEVVIEVVNRQSEQAEWRGVYTESATFTIELRNLKAGTELELWVTADQCSRMNLNLTSGKKLIKDREKPEKTLPEQPTLSARGGAV